MTAGALSRTGCYVRHAKKDRANIDPDELVSFRKLAQAYGRMTDAELAFALSQGDLQELFP
jgi:hypothetical protein